jgi:DNA polymerase II small subunit/DNA polymerase delta subunit B
MIENRYALVLTCLQLAPLSEAPQKKTKEDLANPDLDSLKLLDGLLQQICSNGFVDIMPGESDPACFSLPQRPMHKGLFQKSSAYDTFSTRTNPYNFRADGVE